MEQKKQVYQPYALTLSDAVELMPFAVLAPTKLPWSEDETYRTELRYFSPLAPGYFGILDIYYRHIDGATLLVREGDTSPRINTTIEVDFSDSDEIERGARVLRIISPTGEAGPCYVSFHHGGTHVVIIASALDRERVVDFAASFEVARRNPLQRLLLVPIGRQRPVVIGVALGLLTGVLDGVLSPRDFSYRSLILWMFFFGLAGFMLSLWFRFAAKQSRSRAKLDIVAQLSGGGLWDKELDG